MVIPFWVGLVVQLVKVIIVMRNRVRKEISFLGIELNFIRTAKNAKNAKVRKKG